MTTFYVALVITIAIVICRMIACLPIWSFDPEPMSDADLARILAKNRGWVLHEDAYAHGVELYSPLGLSKFPYQQIKNFELDRVTRI